MWRPEPESNRRARICSPLRNHSAIGPTAAMCAGFRRAKSSRRIGVRYWTARTADLSASGQCVANMDKCAT
jgi:hypothetical protein